MFQTDTAGLLLAGGRARRMSGADKALLPLAGRPLLTYGLERLAMQCSPLLLSANGDPNRFAAFELPVVADADPDRPGPLAGLLAGLDWLAVEASTVTSVLSVPADTPFVPSDLAARLRSARQATSADVAVATSAGRTHPTVALWPVTIRDELRATLALGERRVLAFMNRYRVAHVAWPAEPFDPFFNVNTPDDLAAAECTLRQHSADIIRHDGG